MLSMADEPCPVKVLWPLSKKRNLKSARSELRLYRQLKIRVTSLHLVNEMNPELTPIEPNWRRSNSLTQARDGSTQVKRQVFRIWTYKKHSIFSKSEDSGKDSGFESLILQ